MLAGRLRRAGKNMNNTIYKYFSPERISALEDLQIRISQPGALNDPFEFYNLYNLKEFGGHFVGEGKNNRNSIILQRLVKDYIDNELQKTFNKSINDKFGIISFSRNDSNLLMWAHYAKEYTGFVIGFDSSNVYFTSRIKGLNKNIQDVVYTSKRYEFDISELKINSGLLCTKPIDWAYEEEVRFIDIIDERIEGLVNDQFDYPIVLRNYPKEIITEIILGCKCIVTTDIKKAIKEKCINVRLYQSLLNKNSYTLIKEEIS